MKMVSDDDSAKRPVLGSTNRRGYVQVPAPSIDNRDHRRSPRVVYRQYLFARPHRLLGGAGFSGNPRRIQNRAARRRNAEKAENKISNMVKDVAFIAYRPRRAGREGFLPRRRGVDAQRRLRRSLGGI